jgi:hypothetical protein
MTLIDESQQKDYLDNRLEDQIKWYDGKSSKNQKVFKRLQLVTIVAAACIPFISGYLSSGPDYLKYVVGILGMLVAIATAVNSLYKFQENWIAYRTTCESLQHEKYLYTTSTKPYTGTDAFNLLVERVELLISKENSSWAEVTKKSGEKGN